MDLTFAEFEIVREALSELVSRSNAQFLALAEGKVDPKADLMQFPAYRAFRERLIEINRLEGRMHEVWVDRLEQAFDEGKDDEIGRPKMAALLKRIETEGFVAEDEAA